jgi:hypothetical protein
MSRTAKSVGAEGPERPGGDAFFQEDTFMSATAPMVSRAEQALRQSPHPALRRLSVEVTDDRITNSGRVPSYYLKQLAQEAVMPWRERRELVNQVTVTRV